MAAENFSHVAASGKRRPPKPMTERRSCSRSSSVESSLRLTPITREALRQRAVGEEMEKRREQLAFGEVPGDAEDDDRAGLALRFLPDWLPGDLLGGDACGRHRRHVHASMR